MQFDMHRRAIPHSLRNPPLCFSLTCSLSAGRYCCRRELNWGRGRTTACAGGCGELCLLHQDRPVQVWQQASASSAVPFICSSRLKRVLSPSHTQPHLGHALRGKVCENLFARVCQVTQLRRTRTAVNTIILRRESLSVQKRQRSRDTQEVPLGLTPPSCQHMAALKECKW